MIHLFASPQSDSPEGDKVQSEKHFTTSAQYTKVFNHKRDFIHSIKPNNNKKTRLKHLT